MKPDANLDPARPELFQYLRQELSDERVLSAMENVPRHLFVPEASRHVAYENRALPLGGGQTISQPLERRGVVGNPKAAVY